VVRTRVNTTEAAGDERKVEHIDSAVLVGVELDDIRPGRCDAEGTGDL
jgi:hypothetical protein